jgi:hypothetical protein
MRDYDGLPGYDSWKLATPPEYDEGPPEPEYAEPCISETWDGSAGQYVTQVTFMSGHVFTILPTLRPSWCFEVRDPQGKILVDSFLSVDRALTWLTDTEHWHW